MEEEQKTEKMEEKKQEVVKTEVKHEPKEEKKVQPKKVEHKKKDSACIRGLGLSISTKEGLHICDMIRYKKIDTAIKMTEEVTKMKRAVRMHNRECGHKKGMMGGRYPVNASLEFVRLLKNLRATAIYNGMEIENSIISECKTDMASRPYKRGGAKAKRSHVFIKLIINKQEKAKKTEKKGGKQSK
ncbi:MAG: uL22 family ribosomal protein [archaeon]|nr:uL22 family ribosomal protein [archaeon]